MNDTLGKRICSVARTLDVVGDRWIFLILREAFFGVSHYDQFEKNLGIATNILSDRLKTLVDNDIFTRQKDSKDARRISYRFTEKGIDLYSVTLALLQWGDRWLADDDGPPLILHHKTCGHRLEPVMCCAHCGEPIKAREVTYENGPAIKKAIAQLDDDGNHKARDARDSCK